MEWVRFPHAQTMTEEKFNPSFTGLIPREMVFEIWDQMPCETDKTLVPIMNKYRTGCDLVITDKNSAWIEKPGNEKAWNEMLLIFKELLKDKE